MIITGYRSLFVGDGVEVVEAVETSLPLEVIIEKFFVGMPWEIIEGPMLLQNPGECSTSRHSRLPGRCRRRRHASATESEQQAIAFSFTMKGQTQSVSRGAIIVDRARPAARFLCQAFELGDATLGDTEFFAKLARMKQVLKPMALQKMAEEYLTMSDEIDLPSSIKLRSSFQMETTQLYHQGECWYFMHDLDPDSWSLIVPMQIQVEGHTISRLGFFKHWLNQCYAFDGAALTIVPTSPTSKRLLEKFAEIGKAVGALHIDILPFKHVRAVCWLRIPASEEFGEKELMHTRDTLPPECPPYSYLYSSEAPIPVPHPESLPVIADPSEVMAILSRTQGNIYAFEAPPMPVADDWLQNEPSYLMMTVPTGGSHVS